MCRQMHVHFSAFKFHAAAAAAVLSFNTDHHLFCCMLWQLLHCKVQEALVVIFRRHRLFLFFFFLASVRHNMTATTHKHTQTHTHTTPIHTHTHTHTPVSLTSTAKTGACELHLLGVSWDQSGSLSGATSPGTFGGACTFHPPRGRPWGVGRADPISAPIYALLEARWADSGGPLPSRLHHIHPLHSSRQAVNPRLDWAQQHNSGSNNDDNADNTHAPANAWCEWHKSCLTRLACSGRHGRETCCPGTATA